MKNLLRFPPFPCWLAIALLLPSSISFAAATTKPAQASADELLERRIHKINFWVNDIDGRRVDPPAVAKWLAGLLDDSTLTAQERDWANSRIRNYSAEAEAWLGEFNKRGGHHVFDVIFGGLMGWSRIFTVEPGHDPKLIRDWLAEQQRKRVHTAEDPDPITFDGAAALVRSQEWHHLSAPPDGTGLIVVAALHEIGDAPIRAVFVNDYWAQESGTMKALLGSAFGDDAPVIPLLDHVRWMAVAVTPPPRAHLRIIVKARSPEAAEALNQGLRRLLIAAAEQPEFQTPAVKEAPPLVSPRVFGDELRWEWDDKQIEQAKVLIGPMWHAIHGAMKPAK